MKRERKKEIDKKIKQFKVKSEISNYLNLHNLYFETDEIEGIPYITMVFKNCDRCPGHITEGSIYFYEECMEVRVYYSEIGTQMCNKSKNLPNLYRLMNYLNAMSWPCVKDGMDRMLYSSEYLVSPLIKMPWPLQAGTPVKDIRDGSYYVLVEGEADWNRYLERIEEKNWYVDFSDIQTICYKLTESGIWSHEHINPLYLEVEFPTCIEDDPKRRALRYAMEKNFAQIWF